MTNASLRQWRSHHPKLSGLTLEEWWADKPDIPVRVEHVNPSLDQDSFRARNDDGSESAATWIASANTNWTQAVDENFRVRFLIQETAGGGENNVTPQLQYNLNGAGWNSVDGTSSVVQSSLSSHFADDEDTTQQLGAGTFITPNSGMDEDNGLAGENNDIDFAGNDEVEVEYCVQILSADVADQDTIQLRVVRGDLTVLETYTNTPSITVSEGATSVTVQAAPLTLTAAPQAANPALAALAVQASPVTFNAAPQAATPTLAALAVQAAPVPVGVALSPLSPALAALAISASPLTFSFLVSVVDPQTASSGVVVQANPVTVSAAPQVTSPVLAAFAVQAAPVTLSTVPQAVSPALAALAVQAAPIPVAAQPQAVSPSLAALSISASPLAVALTLSPASPQVTGGAVVVNAAPLVLVVSAQALTVVAFAEPHVVVARTTVIFFRHPEGHLVLSRPKSGARIGFHTREGFEQVSDPFAADDRDTAEAHWNQAMTAVADIWTANSGEDATTLRSLINTELQQRGFRKPNGDDLA